MASLSVSSRIVSLTAVVGLLLGVTVQPAIAVLRVVAALPDVADITRQIGGDRVSVVTIAEGTQDPHKVPVKPSFVTKLNRADALVVQASASSTRSFRRCWRLRATTGSCGGSGLHRCVALVKTLANLALFPPGYLLCP